MFGSRPATAASPFEGCDEVDVECPVVNPVNLKSIIPSIGTVNDRVFHGAAPGTVRLDGSRLHLEISDDGRGAFRVTYSFHCFPWGWNNYRRPTTGRWEPMMWCGKPLFASSDFASLPGMGESFSIRSVPAIASPRRLV